jgi:hypothetical protein
MVRSSIPEEAMKMMMNNESLGSKNTESLEA